MARGRERAQPRRTHDGLSTGQLAARHEACASQHGSKHSKTRSSIPGSLQFSQAQSETQGASPTRLFASRPGPAALLLLSAVLCRAQTVSPDGAPYWRCAGNEAGMVVNCGEGICTMEVLAMEKCGMATCRDIYLIDMLVGCTYYHAPSIAPFDAPCQAPFDAPCHASS